MQSQGPNPYEAPRVEVQRAPLMRRLSAGVRRARLAISQSNQREGLSRFEFVRTVAVVLFILPMLLLITAAVVYTLWRELVPIGR